MHRGILGLAFHCVSSEGVGSLELARRVASNSGAGLRLTLRSELKCVYNPTSGHQPLVAQGSSRQQEVGAWSRVLVAQRDTK